MSSEIGCDSGRTGFLLLSTVWNTYTFISGHSHFSAACMYFLSGFTSPCLLMSYSVSQVAGYMRIMLVRGVQHCLDSREPLISSLSQWNRFLTLAPGLSLEDLRERWREWDSFTKTIHIELVQSFKCKHMQNELADTRLLEHKGTVHVKIKILSSFHHLTLKLLQNCVNKKGDTEKDIWQYAFNQTVFGHHDYHSRKISLYMSLFC